VLSSHILNIKVVARSSLMRVVFFLVCLCSLLLGPDKVHAATHYTQNYYTPTEPHEQALHNNYRFQHHEWPVIKSTSGNKQASEPFAEAIEEEENDENDLSAKKARQLAQSSITLPPAFVFFCLHYNFNGRPSACGYASCKYITQRVLRI
jgi:hypothetical protein